MGKAVKTFLVEDNKVLHEFHCSNCDGYITAKLAMAIDGAHVIHCSNCGHEHYRIVTNGEITEDRAPNINKGSDYYHHIHLPKSAFSKTSWEIKMIQQRRSKDDYGFLSELWKRMVAIQN